MIEGLNKAVCELASQWCISVRRFGIFFLPLNEFELFWALLYTDSSSCIHKNFYLAFPYSVYLEYQIWIFCSYLFLCYGDKNQTGRLTAKNVTFGFRRSQSFYVQQNPISKIWRKHSDFCTPIYERENKNNSYKRKKINKDFPHSISINKLN